MHPKVSVIIPTYNSEKYIAQAIESVLQQTESNLEAIVVDDASVDMTVEIVQQYSSDRVKLLIEDCNRGPSYTRNRGIKAAQGEWIALLDSDDWYAPYRLEKLLQVAGAENADFVADDLYLIHDDAKQPWSTRFSIVGGFGSRRICFDAIAQISAVDFVELDLGLVKPIIKRDFLIQHQLGFDENLRYGEDFALFLTSLLHGAKFIIVPTPYYFYRSRSDSLITDYIKSQEQMHQSSVELLKKELVQNNLKVIRSLSKRTANFERSLKMGQSYNRVIVPLKQGNFSIAIFEMVRNPLCFKFYSWQTLRKISYRLRYFMNQIGFKKINSKA